MRVQMEYGLSAVNVRVDDNSVPAFGKFLFTRDVRGGKHYMAERFLVLIFSFVQRIKMFTGNDEYMVRCLRVDVIERNADAILVNKCRRNLPGNYFAENAVRIAHGQIRILKHKPVQTQ